MNKSSGLDLLRTLYGTALTCRSRIQPTRLAKTGRPFDILTGRNESFKPPMNQDVESCRLVNDDDDDDRLIGVDELIESVAVPDLLS